MTHNELIDKLGGNTAVANLCGITPQAVSQWRTNGIPKAHQAALNMKQEQRVSMSKPDLLRLMRLLSGVESLLVYTQRKLDQQTFVPDYLLEELSGCAEMLEKEILK